LIWCLPLAKATSWWSAYSLGRLAAALQPDQIKILLCDDEVEIGGPVVVSRSLVAPENDALDSASWHDDLKKQCRVVHAAGGLPGSLEVLVLPAPVHGANRSAILHGVVRGLIQGAQITGSTP
jgi:hypothetical protein